MVLRHFNAHILDQKLNSYELKLVIDFEFLKVFLKTANEMIYLQWYVE